MVFCVNVDDELHRPLEEIHIVRYFLKSLCLCQKNVSASVNSVIFAVWPNTIILMAPIETENCQHWKRQLRIVSTEREIMSSVLSNTKKTNTKIQKTRIYKSTHIIIPDAPIEHCHHSERRRENLSKGCFQLVFHDSEKNMSQSIL